MLTLFLTQDAIVRLVLELMRVNGLAEMLPQKFHGICVDWNLGAGPSRPDEYDRA